MRTILTKQLGQVLAVLALAGTASLVAGHAAQARDGYWGHHWEHWQHPHYWGRPWAYRHEYAPRYYAPPVWAYEPAPYYGPPSINFTIPLR